MKLYRPVGLYEMEKILNADGKGFPPRYKEQPIFYPVIYDSYAQQIAEQWNTEDVNSGYAGFVTEFEVNDDNIKNFIIHCVGSENHEEFWIPAENLKEFNEHIIGTIQMKHAYFGSKYTGLKPSGRTGFKENDIFKQIKILASILEYNAMDFSGTVFVEWKLITLNFLFWYTESLEYRDVLEAIYHCLKKNNRLYTSMDESFKKLS